MRGGAGQSSWMGQNRPMWPKEGGHAVQCSVAAIVAVLKGQPDDTEVGKAILPFDPTVRPITARALLRALESVTTSTVVCQQSDAPCYIIDMQDWPRPSFNSHLWLAIFDYSPLYAVIREHHRSEASYQP